MAKKSTKKNSLKALWSFLTLIFAGAIFGMLALPFVKYGGSAGSHSISSSSSGYELLDFNGNTAIATVILLLVIFASLLVVVSIMKLCADCGVIKNKSAKKFLSFALVVLSLAVLAMCVVCMIVVPTECDSIGSGSFSVGSYASWLGLIFTTVVGIGATITSIYAVKK